jgi:hypothetical protein
MNDTKAIPKSAQEVTSTLAETKEASNSSYQDETVFLNLQLEFQIRSEHLATLRTNNEARVRYARRTFYLTCLWIIVVMTIVILNGVHLIHLSDTVLVTLITTTTINVFGFFLLVIKYLFNVKNPT